LVAGWTNGQDDSHRSGTQRLIRSAITLTCRPTVEIHQRRWISTRTVGSESTFGVLRPFLSWQIAARKKVFLDTFFEKFVNCLGACQAIGFD
jgi:hypothetical protein